MQLSRRKVNQCESPWARAYFSPSRALLSGAAADIDCGPARRPRCSHRLAAQDVALSRRKHRFESGWERHVRRVISFISRGQYAVSARISHSGCSQCARKAPRDQIEGVELVAPSGGLWPCPIVPRVVIREDTPTSQVERAGRGGAALPRPPLLDRPSRLRSNVRHPPAWTCRPISPLLALPAEPPRPPLRVRPDHVAPSAPAGASTKISGLM